MELARSATTVIPENWIGYRHMIRIAKEEDLRSLQTLLRFYEKAAPIIRRIANVEMLNYGQLPASPFALFESNLTLKMILNALKKMSAPKDKMLATIYKEFGISLSSCIRTVEAVEKYGELGDRSNKSHILLTNIISSTVLAYEYLESVAHKLESSAQAYTSPEIEPTIAIPQGRETTRWKPVAVQDDVTVRKRALMILNSMACGIEWFLDKLGDLIVFPFVAISRLFAGIRKSRGREFHEP